MSVRSAVYGLITADSTTMTLLTGGFYAAIEIKRSDPDTAAAFDTNGEIKPSGLIKVATEVADGPTDNSSRDFINIYLYQFTGTSIIDQVKDRLRVLLHKARISAENVWEVRWVNSITDQEDPALECSMHLITFEAVRYIG